ncbi:hypothetical protein [Alkalibacterium olivapovliticus]|uniref:Uncharacterized protein n=1 Tax=Alkalibacterium olivapovliticus TaxID=99907 RepID=A0A2T0WA50_9LACT|nr:hypothetical protein [Alkalibacterium olivapovliticus]PRY83588.1 hypothetical protein CLV38_10311 [Alkalibacterium olivapovliticus]
MALLPYYSQRYMAAFTPVDIVMMDILTFFVVWIPTIVFPVTEIRKIEKDKRG